MLKITMKREIYREIHSNKNISKLSKENCFPLKEI